MGPRKVGGRGPDGRIDARVGYLDSFLYRAAKGYAAATARLCNRYRSFEDALADPALRVLVIGAKPLGLAQLEQIATRTEPIGLLPVFDPLRPLEAARSAYLYTHCRRRGPGRRISHYPLDDRVGLNSPNLAVAGAVSPRRAADLWKRPAALKLVQTHCDGVDAFVANRLTACGRAAWGAEGGGNPPNCVRRNHCHRHDLSFDDPLLAMRILDPAVLTAGVLLWDVCFAAPTAESLTGAGWSLFRRLWSAAAVGAVVTNFELAITNAGRLEKLGDTLVASPSLGEGLKVARRQRPFVRKDSRWLLFGDPDIAVSAPFAPPRGRGGGRIEKRVEAPRRSALSSALCAAGEFGLADAFSGRESGSDEVVLRWAVDRGKIYDLWMGVDDVAVQGKSVCAGCDRPARCFSSSSAAPHRRRLLHICSACGVVGDVDAPGVPLLRRVGNRAILTGFPPSVTGRAILQLWSGQPDMSHAAEWPIRNQQPVLSFTIPAAWRHQSGRLSLFLIHEDDLTVFSCLFCS